MSIAFIDTGPAAFLAGLAVSPHCAGMCAPLACALAPWNGPREQRTVFATAHHVSRVIAYAAVGAVAGGLGVRFARWIEFSPARWLPWAAAAFCLLVALGVDKAPPMPRVVSALGAKLLMRLRNAPPTCVGAALGALTPLIPCGPMHGVFALAFLGASASHGAEIAAGFALGTLPLLWAAQAGYYSLRFRLGERRVTMLRRFAALVAGLALAWRAAAGCHDNLCG